MTTDRTSTEILIRCTPAEACLIAQALASYGDAIDSRCAPLALAILPTRDRLGVVTVDELDAVAQGAAEVM